MSSMESLIGLTITALHVNDGEGYLKFETNNGVKLFEAEGDCCSESWFADIYNPEALLGHTILKAEDLYDVDCNLDDGRGRQEIDQSYGIKLTTSQGVTDIIYRNSSNGYYGGWCQEIDEMRSWVNPNWEAITEDWSA